MLSVRSSLPRHSYAFVSESLNVTLNRGRVFAGDLTYTVSAQSGVDDLEPSSPIALILLVVAGAVALNVGGAREALLKGFKGTSAVAPIRGGGGEGEDGDSYAVNPKWYQSGPKEKKGPKTAGKKR